MMTLVPAKTELLAAYGQITGVIHVGAHRGEEIPWYLHKGYAPIIAVEPQAGIFEQLHVEFGGHPNVTLVNAAMGREFGTLVLNIPLHLDRSSLDTMGASKYFPAPGQEYDYNRNKLMHRQVVPLMTLDGLMATFPDDQAFPNCLVIDVQGMEMDVLLGAQETLAKMDFLNIECSAIPVYDGEVPASNIVKYLRLRGFRAITPIEPHDDILFVRTRR